MIRAKLLNQKYSVSKQIAYRKIEGKGLFLLPDDHFVQELNESGQYIWDMIMKKEALDKIVKKFSTVSSGILFGLFSHVL